MEGGSSQSATTARRRTPGRWRRIPRQAMEESLTLAAPAGGSAAPPASAALPGCSTASGSAGSTEGGSSQSAPTVRRRTPGRWRRIPRPMPAWVTKPTALVVVGSAEWAKVMEADKQATLQWADELEKADEDLCDTEEDKVAFRAFKAKFVPFMRRLANMKPEDVVLVYKKPSDTQEEHLTAEDMEARFPGGQACHQARHFAELALMHYNAKKKMHKFDLATVLLSKCFTEMCGTTFAHVNFTATSHNQSAAHPSKRLFFAELMLVAQLQAYNDVEPMRVLHVCTIDNDSVLVDATR